MESKLGTRVDQNGEPIASEEVPETVEEVRKMRYKLHPICKLCNLQSWNDRKNKKKGWCPGFEPHTDVDVHYCRYCLHHFMSTGGQNHPITLNTKDFPGELGENGDDEDVDYDEEGNEIRIDVPQNQRNIMTAWQMLVNITKTTCKI